MATRRLRRVGLAEDIVQRCEKQKILTCRDFLSLSQLELINLLDMPWKAINDISLTISESVAPAVTTVYDKLAEVGNISYLKTTLDGVDKLLRGGIPPGSITEIVGPSGTGKSQMCHMLSVLAVAPVEKGGCGGSVVYIDTEMSFSAARLVEIAESMFPEVYSREGTNNNNDSLYNLTQQITVFSNFSTSQEVLKRIESLDELIVEKNVKLVVLDSVASIVRKEFDINNIFQRQELLAQEAALLKYIAETYKIPIVVTNQVTTVFSKSDPVFEFQSGAAKTQGTTTAALGPLWAHSVNTRLVLEYTNIAKNISGDSNNDNDDDVDGDGDANMSKMNEDGDSIRKITLAKSPTAPVASFLYRIGACGLILVEAANNKQNFWGQRMITR